MSRENIIVWVLFTLALLVVLLTRVRLRSEEEGGGKKVSRLAVNIHTAAGVFTAIAWVGYKATGEALLGMIGLIVWWVLAFAGLALLVRWLPTHGKHVSHEDEDEWAEGPGLSLVAHFGVVIGITVVTLLYATNKV